MLHNFEELQQVDGGCRRFTIVVVGDEEAQKARLVLIKMTLDIICRNPVS